MFNCKSWEDDLYKYITGIIKNNRHKLLAINGMPDHVHVFFGMRPIQSLSDLIQDIKGSSSKWINDQQLARARFEWQAGYGAFSYSRSQVDQVVRYINDQEMHHKKKTFLEEYRGFLKKFGIDYKEQYIFNEV